MMAASIHNTSSASLLNRGKRTSESKDVDSQVHHGVCKIPVCEKVSQEYLDRLPPLNIERGVFGYQFITALYRIVFPIREPKYRLFQDGSFIIEDSDKKLFEILSKGYFNRENGQLQIAKSALQLQDDITKIQSPGYVPLTHLVAWLVKGNKKGKLIDNIWDHCYKTNSATSVGSHRQCQQAKIIFHSICPDFSREMEISITRDMKPSASNFTNVPMYERIIHPKYTIQLPQDFEIKEKPKGVIKFYSYSIEYYKQQGNIERNSYTFIKFESSSVCSDSGRHAIQNMKKGGADYSNSVLRNLRRDMKRTVCSVKNKATRGRRVPCYRCEDVCHSPARDWKEEQLKNFPSSLKWRYRNDEDDEEGDIYKLWKSLFNPREHISYKKYRLGQEYYVSIGERDSIINYLSQLRLRRPRTNSIPKGAAVAFTINNNANRINSRIGTVIGRRVGGKRRKTRKRMKKKTRKKRKNRKKRTRKR